MIISTSDPFSVKSDRLLGGRLRRAGIPRDLADQLMYKIAALPTDPPRTLLR